MDKVCFVQSYEIKSPPWTIVWFRILGIFIVENINRSGEFMFQTSDRRGLDFIALILSTNPSFVIEPIEKVKTKSASFRKKRCGSLDWNCCFDYNWMGSRAQRVEYS